MSRSALHEEPGTFEREFFGRIVALKIGLEISSSQREEHLLAPDD